MSGVLSSIETLASNFKLGPWALNLQGASWRGVPFKVRSSTVRRGRRTATHEYPLTDIVWVEDLGRATRVYSFIGFLVGDDVHQQRDRLVKQCDLPGSGPLVHPSLGRITASLVEFAEGERTEFGRCIELQFAFVETAPAPKFPTGGLLSSLSSLISAGQSALATVTGYINTVTTLISGLHAGITFASNLFSSVRGLVGGFASYAGVVSTDTLTLFHAVAGLPDANYGRYAAAARTTGQPSGSTVASVIAATTTARGAVITAAAAVTAASDPQTLATALQALTEAVRAVAQSPSDQIRMLSKLAAYQPTLAPVTANAILSSTINGMLTATAGFCRQAALISIGNAVAAYSPASYDEAMAILSQVLALYDSEILAAADAGNTETYLALRALRSAVAGTLTEEAAQLPHLRTFSSAAPMPALALAYELYGDANRSDELVGRANPVSPLFMPLAFKALSS